MRSGDIKLENTVSVWLSLSLFSPVVSPLLVSSFHVTSASGGRPGCRPRSSEHLLRGVGDVEEAVSVPVARIHLAHAGGHAGHAPLCHQEEQSLGGVQGDLIPK